MLVKKARWAKEIHIVLDNLSATQRRPSETFLSNIRSFDFIFTPTYSSWLNQVEIWFAKIEQDRARCHCPWRVHLRSRSFAEADEYRAYAKSAQPIRWTYTNRKRRISATEISGTSH